MRSKLLFCPLYSALKTWPQYRLARTNSFISLHLSKFLKEETIYKYSLDSLSLPLHLCSYVCDFGLWLISSMVLNAEIIKNVWFNSALSWILVISRELLMPVTPGMFSQKPPWRQKVWVSVILKGGQLEIPSSTFSINGDEARTGLLISK